MITDIAQALRLAETAGRVMLENGAETYRAEDTVIHVCRSMGLPDVQVLVIPTGIFLTLRDQGGQRHTSVIRVNRRSINLDSIHQANAIARRVGELSVQEAIDQLEALHTRPQYPDWLNTLSAALCSGFFALVFGGGALEFAIAAIAGLMAALLESVSAIGTVGLSTGITPHIGLVSKMLLAMLMLFGRVGSITMLLAFSSERTASASKLPVEKIQLG